MGVWVQVLPENPDNPFRLGRHIERDERHLTLFRWPWSKPVEEVDVVWPGPGPILNQAAVGGCTGFTDADMINYPQFDAIRKKLHPSGYMQDGDGLNFYHQSTVISAIGGGQVWPPNDVGSSGPAAAQAAENDGYFGKYLHGFTWAEFQSAIATQPVMIGSVWTDSMFTPNSDGVISVGDVNNGDGGHEYSVRAVLYTRNLVLMRNHWYAEDNVTPWSNTSDGIKQPGEAYITIPDFKRLLAAQGDITIPSPAAA